MVTDSPNTPVLICVSTYRRPAEIVRFIESVLPQIEDEEATLAVVDNDPRAGASDIVRDYPNVIYIHEPKPGIAATRNRALETAEEGRYASLIFLDDDEWVSTNWYERFRHSANETDAGIVAGPVVTVYGAEIPAWIRRYGFHSRTQLPHGSRPSSAASHNTWLKIADWRRVGSPSFDDSFSVTGGSDTDFFTRLHDAGVCIEYTRTPIVYEEVPPERASIRWVSRRGMRTGMVKARLDLRKQGRTRVAISGIARIGKGLVATPLALMFTPAKVSDRYAGLMRGVGMLTTAVTKYSIQEYARSD